MPIINGQNTGDAWDFADGYNYDQIMLVWVRGLCTAWLTESAISNGFHSMSASVGDTTPSSKCGFLGSALPVYDQIMLVWLCSRFRPCG